eukprot:GHVR01171309.1.p1 GENE.GHVR01171309.1~~GHVR01171309.1.p1  ORF type:complete len:103 (-),score=54.22 GHVR01171309.1:72-344(-)
MEDKHEEWLKNVCVCGDVCVCNDVCVSNENISNDVNIFKLIIKYMCSAVSATVRVTMIGLLLFVVCVCVCVLMMVGHIMIEEQQAIVTLF